MNWFDLIIIGIIAVSALISLIRGFTKESISLASWITAGLVALYYLQPVEQSLVDYIESPTMRIGSGFGVLFLGILIIGAIVNYIAGKMVAKTGLSVTDKSLGVVFGGIRGVIVVTTLILLGGLTPMPTEIWWSDSALVEYFEHLAIWIKQVLPEDISNQFLL